MLNPFKVRLSDLYRHTANDDQIEFKQVNLYLTMAKTLPLGIAASLVLVEIVSPPNSDGVVFWLLMAPIFIAVARLGLIGDVFGAQGMHTIRVSNQHITMEIFPLASRTHRFLFKSSLFTTNRNRMKARETIVLQQSGILEMFVVTHEMLNQEFVCLAATSLQLDENSIVHISPYFKKEDNLAKYLDLCLPFFPNRHFEEE
tara:strand:- start:170 stop:772 length:603 start_codon:yes stop_codon:yes gene_type:complete